MKNTFDAFASEIIANPYPALARLRAADPVSWNEPLKGWLLTTYDDVKAAQKDSRFSAERVKPFTMHMAATKRPELERMGTLLNHWLLFRDPPAHTPLRRLLIDAFTPRAINALRPRIGEIVEELLDPLSDRNQFDMISDFAFPMPATVIAHILGVPSSDVPKFRTWSNDLATVIGNSRQVPDRFERGARALFTLTDYFRTTVSHRRNARTKGVLVDDLIAAQESGGPMSEEELVASCILILFAGHETTMNLIGNATLLLVKNPDQWALLRNDPNLISSMVEEVLRYECAAFVIVRVANEDIEIGGKRISKGDRVFLMLGAANRDPIHFDDPERFDILRKPNRHLSFGFGIHFCIGAQLARVEAEVAFKHLLPLMKDFEPVSDDFDWDDNFVLRGVKSLLLQRRAVAAA